MPEDLTPQQREAMEAAFESADSISPDSINEFTEGFVAGLAYPSEEVERLRKALLVSAIHDDRITDLFDLDSLFAEGLLMAGRDFTGEGYTEIAEAGHDFILAALSDQGASDA